MRIYVSKSDSSAAKNMHASLMKIAPIKADESLVRAERPCISCWCCLWEVMNILLSAMHFHPDIIQNYCANSFDDLYRYDLREEFKTNEMHVHVYMLIYHFNP